MQVFVANAWICAQRATDRDLESFFLRMLGYAHSGQPTVILRQRKVNAWTCARHSTDHDLESVFVKFQHECLDMCLSDNRP